ncbi:hypothetical protein TPA0908_33380 [Micromonospora sp. AKA38]|nr:hypothetical protein TPA0908_33380 [Micromonospora sp. AKA38]
MRSLRRQGTQHELRFALLLDVLKHRAGGATVWPMAVRRTKIRCTHMPPTVRTGSAEVLAFGGWFATGNVAAVGS